MEVQNDVWQGFVSSILSESMKGNLAKDVLSPEDTAWVDSCPSILAKDVLSPEDTAWVDSCLVNDPELTDNSWNALKDALLDIVSSQATSHYEASAPGVEGLPREAYDGVVPMSEEAETEDFHVGADGIFLSTIEKPETSQWVDSCLVNDPELTDNSWNPLKDALLDVVRSQPTSHYEASAHGVEGLPRGAYDGVVPMSDEAETEDVPVEADDIFLSILANLGGTDDNVVPSTARPQSYFRNGVLYEFCILEENEDNQIKVDLGSMNEIDASSENIFRVWDFDTPTVEFELDQQLIKAFTDSSLEAKPPTLDNSLSDLGEQSLDNLIAGLADLSLVPSPSWK